MIANWTDIKFEKLDDRVAFDEREIRQLIFSYIDLPDREFRQRAVSMIERHEWKLAVYGLCDYYNIDKPILSNIPEAKGLLTLSDEKISEILLRHGIVVDVEDFIYDFANATIIAEAFGGATLTKPYAIIINESEATPHLVLHEFFHYLDEQLIVVPKGVFESKAIERLVKEACADAYANAFLDRRPSTLKVPVVGI